MRRSSIGSAAGLHPDAGAVVRPPTIVGDPLSRQLTGTTPEGDAARVLVVSASMGAGHDRAANELHRRLVDRGHVVRTVDLLQLPLHGEGQALRATYGFVLRQLPWLYDAAMQVWQRWPRVMERFTSTGGGAYERGLLAAVRDFEPDVVVSTYNLASQALARLKRTARLDVPLATYVTDPGAHPYWVCDEVDLHLAVAPDTADALARLGAPQVAFSGPLARPEFLDAPDRATARRVSGLPPDARVVLVTAGSWGVGDIEHTVELLARDPSLLPVTLCGHDHRLHERLQRRGLGRPMGWTDDVATLMAAADVLVDNAGGLTCLEALVTGLPVVVFRPLPGHGRLNARTLHDAGRVRWVDNDDDLLAAVRLLAAPGALREGQVERGREILGGDVAVEVLKLAFAARAMR